MRMSHRPGVAFRILTRLSFVAVVVLTVASAHGQARPTDRLPLEPPATATAPATAATGPESAPTTSSQPATATATAPTTSTAPTTTTAPATRAVPAFSLTQLADRAEATDAALKRVEASLIDDPVIARMDGRLD